MQAKARAGTGRGVWLARGAVAVPYCCLYPVASRLGSVLSEQRYRHHLNTARCSPSPLSLYIHIPFDCRRGDGGDGGDASRLDYSNTSARRCYLKHLYTELTLLAEQLGSRKVGQLHLLGSTFCYLEQSELTELVHHLACQFNLDDSSEREFAIELDPRWATEDYLALLKGLGFNRLSFGVHNCHLRAQRTTAPAPEADAGCRAAAMARRYKFRSVSAELIYGQPLQSKASFATALGTLMAMAPDRITLQHYRYLPWRFKGEVAMVGRSLANSDAAAWAVSLAREQLQTAGYQHIGLELFVRPEDEIARCQRQGRLLRNLYGYSSCYAADVFGVGLAAVSALGGCYAQNHRLLVDYYAALDEGQLAFARGVELNADDLLYRYVVVQLACSMGLDFLELYSRFHVRFHDTFAELIAPLEELAERGAVVLNDQSLQVTDIGRLLLSDICMLFDQVLCRE